MPRAQPDRDHYVINCARKYAATLRQLRLEPSREGRAAHRRMLHFLMEAGIDEHECEWRWRKWRLPDDIRMHADGEQKLPPGRRLTVEEAKLVIALHSIPPVATMQYLSATDMVALADVYDGWAHDPRLEPFDIARLLGWADGMRLLVDAIGMAYEPPAKAPGEPDSLLKFLARRVRNDAEA